MISLAGFEPLSVAKINIFSSATGVLQKDFLQKDFRDKVHAILIEEVPIQTTLCYAPVKVNPDPPHPGI